MFYLSGSMQSAALPAVLALLSTSQAQNPTLGASPSAPSTRSSQKLVISVNDENGVAVPSARVQLRSPANTSPMWCAADFSGRCTIEYLTSSSCPITVDKPGFYAARNLPINTAQAPSLNMKLFHIQEVQEVINVVESPPGIDTLQAA